MKKKETKLKSNEFYLNKNYPKLKKRVIVSLINEVYFY
jgi:hypothetical protein